MSADNLPVPPYKLAKVYNSEREWFVYYSWWSKVDQAYKREKVRTGSRGLTQKQRAVELADLCDQINVHLKYRNKHMIYHEDVLGTGGVRLLTDWLEELKQDPEIPKTTRENFSALQARIRAFAKADPRYSEVYTVDVTDEFVADFAAFLQRPDAKGRRYVGKTVNMYLWGVSAALKQIKKRSGVVASPDISVARVKQVKNATGKYPPLTHEEKERIFTFFQKHKPEYYLFLMFVYYTCIRPAELHRLQVGNIDFVGRKIYVPWFAAKNGLSKYVQILEPLCEALSYYQVDKLDKDLYLFAAGCKPGKDPHRGSSISSDYWDHYRDRVGLDKSKHQYGLKHTFNIDYVERNRQSPDWEFLRNHNRHATIQQTQAYISSLTAYFVDEGKHEFYNYFKNDNNT